MAFTHQGRIDHDHATFGVAADVEENRFVVMTATGEVQHAVGGDKVLGVAQRAVTLASGEPVAVRLTSAPSQVATASAAIAIGTEVAHGADGKVAAGAGGYVAINEALADGDTLVIVPVR